MLFGTYAASDIHDLFSTKLRSLTLVGVSAKFNDSKIVFCGWKLFRDRTKIMGAHREKIILIKTENVKISPKIEKFTHKNRFKKCAEFWVNISQFSVEFCVIQSMSTIFPSIFFLCRVHSNPVTFFFNKLNRHYLNFSRLVQHEVDYVEIVRRKRWYIVIPTNKRSRWSWGCMCLSKWVTDLLKMWTNCANNKLISHYEQFAQKDKLLQICSKKRMRVLEFLNSNFHIYIYIW